VGRPTRGGGTGRCLLRGELGLTGGVFLRGESGRTGAVDVICTLGDDDITCANNEAGGGGGDVGRKPAPAVAGEACDGVVGMVFGAVDGLGAGLGGRMKGGGLFLLGGVGRSLVISAVFALFAAISTLALC